MTRKKPKKIVRLSKLKQCQKKVKSLQSEASAFLDKADNLCAEAEKSYK